MVGSTVTGVMVASQASRLSSRSEMSPKPCSSAGSPAGGVCVVVGVEAFGGHGDVEVGSESAVGGEAVFHPGDRQVVECVDAALPGGPVVVGRGCAGVGVQHGLERGPGGGVEVSADVEPFPDLGDGDVASFQRPEVGRVGSVGVQGVAGLADGGPDRVGITRLCDVEQDRFDRGDGVGTHLVQPEADLVQGCYPEPASGERGPHPRQRIQGVGAAGAASGLGRGEAQLAAAPHVQRGCAVLVRAAGGIEGRGPVRGHTGEQVLGVLEPDQQWPELGDRGRGGRQVRQPGGLVGDRAQLLGEHAGGCDRATGHTHTLEVSTDNSGPGSDLRTLIHKRNLANSLEAATWPKQHRHPAAQLRHAEPAPSSLPSNPTPNGPHPKPPTTPAAGNPTRPRSRTRAVVDATNPTPADPHPNTPSDTAARRPNLTQRQLIRAGRRVTWPFGRQLCELLARLESNSDTFHYGKFWRTHSA